MADGAYRFQQPGATPFYHPQHSQQQSLHRNLNPPSPHPSRRPFSSDTPSPSRSPVNPASSHAFNMYSHNGYQGQHGLINGGQSHQRYGMPMPKYQQTHHPHHAQMHPHQTPHHHGGHMGHQHTLSSGAYSNAASHLVHYGQDHSQSGASDSMHHDELDDIESEFWQEQVRLAAELRDASSPHHRAKAAAKQTHGINFVPTGAAAEQEVHQEEQNRAVAVQKDQRQTWGELDCGGQGLRALSDALFQYTFLQRLVLTHNKLEQLPPSIGKLKNLQHLDVSYNQLVYLPEEIGMLTNLTHLFLFGNHIQSLPYELGYLYKLEVLGIEGNRLDDELMAKLVEEGTKGLVHHLLENMPGTSCRSPRHCQYADMPFRSGPSQ